MKNEKLHLLTHGALANANANAKVAFCRLLAIGYWLLAWYLANYEVICIKLMDNPLFTQSQLVDSG